MVKKIVKSDHAERILKIENEFSIRNVGEITNKLKKNIRNAKTVLLKLEHIDQLDLSAIQVIHALKNYANEKSIELKMEVQVSDDVRSLLANTGFKDALDIQ